MVPMYKNLYFHEPETETHRWADMKEAGICLWHFFFFGLFLFLPICNALILLGGLPNFIVVKSESSESGFFRRVFKRRN